MEHRTTAIARGCVYSPCLSFSLTLRLASTSAASAAACAASKRYLRTAYSGSVSQWVASPFKAASSPSRRERSRAVSLATSFGSCGPTYEPNILSRTVAIPLPGRCQRVTHAG
jgi:hypothetical protein